MHVVLVIPYLPSRYPSLWRVHGRDWHLNICTHCLPTGLAQPLNFYSWVNNVSVFNFLKTAITQCLLVDCQPAGMVWGGWQGLVGWANGCKPATGLRDPPDGSKLALHRTKQKLYVAVKELELGNSIGCLECVKQTENSLSVYFVSLSSIAWMVMIM